MAQINDKLTKKEIKAFTDLNDEQKDALIKVFSRVSEASYRRGFQQGVTLTEDGRETNLDIHTWRFGTSLDIAPWVDGNIYENSVNRLFCEFCGGLNILGLFKPTSVSDGINHEPINNSKRKYRRVSWEMFSSIVKNKTKS